MKQNRKEIKKVILTEDKNTNLKEVARFTQEFWKENPDLKASLGK